MRPAAKVIGTRVRREDVPPFFGVQFNTGNWQSGHVTAIEDDVVLFVTLTKEANRIEEAYLDQFEDRSTFHWTSQSNTSPEGKKGRELLGSLSSGTRVHLFVRNKRSDRGFIYAGLVTPLRHEGAKPMVVWFRMLTALTDEVAAALRLSF
jgi:hypothetical protein